MINDVIFNDKPKVEASQKKKQQKEHTLLGSIKKIKGLTLFEYNKVTGELKPANFSENTVYQIGKETAFDLVINKDCAYVQALNKKNAIKHIRKQFISFSQP